jgi:DNA modification methylase
MEYKSDAEPRAVTSDGAQVFCAFDKLIPISELKPNPGNPNTHSKKQIELLAKIIKATGWRAPITVSTRSGLMVKGHGRRMAAIAAGIKEVPVEYQAYASEEEEHADLIADNRIAELAEIDTSKLLDMLQDLDDGTVPLELTGYNDKDMEGLIAALSGADDTEDDGKDKETEQPSQPFSKMGDLWHLGRHRLLCGSATSTEDIDRLMDGAKAQMVHTDPPYGVSYETQSGKFEMIQNDDMQHDDLYDKLLLPAMKNYVRVTDDTAAFYVWHASSTRRDFEDALIAAGLMEKQYIIWAKNAPVLGHADYQWAHEPCFYCEKAGHQAAYYGDRSQRTVWRATMRGAGEMSATLSGGIVLTDGAGAKVYICDKPPKGKKVRYVRLKEDGASIYLYQESDQNDVWEIARESKTIHPTQKPLEIPSRAIRNSTKEGDLVLDFFGGSGSTLIAAHQLGRTCYSTELDPKFVDGIVMRFAEEAPGTPITVERDGKEIPLADILEQR